MTYEEALEYIHSVSWKGSVPGLERITELCRRLGDPQNGLRFVHVAGTNGKGSVSAMTASVLRSAGYKVGLFTSPYLVDFCERINIDGSDVSHDALVRAVERVRPFADSMEDSPTEFELITAVGFVCFADAGCDIVVLECGMGGRLDSTNVIAEAEASVITNIALDHTAILGDTVEKIAAEKAGIVKNAPVVVGHTDDSPREVIAEKCRMAGVSMIRADGVVLDGIDRRRDGISFTYEGKRLSVPLCGLYQITNVRTVLSVIGVLRGRGWNIPDESVADGLSSVKWKGRFEKLSDDPVFIFDGAHNPDGAEYTASTFEALYPGTKAYLVTGVLADKDYTAIAASLARVTRYAFTFTPDSPRALDAKKWAEALKAAGVAGACACESARQAVHNATSSARRRKCPVLCAGSLYSYAAVAASARRFIKVRRRRPRVLPFDRLVAEHEASGKKDDE